MTSATSQNRFPHSKQTAYQPHKATKNNTSILHISDYSAGMYPGNYSSRNSKASIIYR